MPADRSSENPLRDYFDSHRSGRGIWKHLHYFDIYHRHFEKFRGQEVHLLEVGVYSGGSLEMWKHYFGPRCRVYGVDIEEACKAYEDESVRIFIGDQGDREFWAAVREEVPPLDIVIDDGGHRAVHQRVTFEELFPHVRPNGVYLCEDIARDPNKFAQYLGQSAMALNEHVVKSKNRKDNERRAVYATNELQANVRSITFYPFVAVIEKNTEPLAEIVSTKRGTEWQPFLA